VRRIIDLSAPIVANPTGTPPFQSDDVLYVDHAEGAREIADIYGVPAHLLRDREGWSREVISLGTHNATHVDAPYHYNSRIQGSPASTIDELPLERFFGPGVVVDFTAKADGDAITADEMAQALVASGHPTRPGDIVLVHTGRDAFYGQPGYIDRGPGVTAEATRWLYEQGIEVMGIDAWGWDRPLRMQAQEALDREATGVFWEAHQVGLPYSQIERLVNLASLPPTGFMVACFPLRIVRASAAPARVVAILEHDDKEPS
jgi:kynurenine formamidase